MTEENKIRRSIVEALEYSRQRFSGYLARHTKVERVYREMRPMAKCLGSPIIDSLKVAAIGTLSELVFNSLVSWSLPNPRRALYFGASLASIYWITNLGKDAFDFAVLGKGRFKEFSTSMRKDEH